MKQRLPLLLLAVLLLNLTTAHQETLVSVSLDNLNEPKLNVNTELLSHVFSNISTNQIETILTNSVFQTVKKLIGDKDVLKSPTKFMVETMKSKVVSENSKAAVASLLKTIQPTVNNISSSVIEKLFSKIKTLDLSSIILPVITNLAKEEATLESTGKIVKKLTSSFFEGIPTTIITTIIGAATVAFVISVFIMAGLMWLIIYCCKKNTKEKGV